MFARYNKKEINFGAELWNRIFYLICVISFLHFFYVCSFLLNIFMTFITYHNLSAPDAVEFIFSHEWSSLVR